MNVIELQTPSSRSEIYCGEGAYDKITAKLNYKQLFVVTDTNVYALYGGLISSTFAGAPVCVIPAGEGSKNYNQLIAILTKMADAGLTRSSCVIAFGGGVVGDIAGLAASLYMRGVHLVQIPTTLLSQVDSSVGGKTAVDLGKIKNAIGTFYQPEQVIVDPMFLRTLPERELRCGMGEIVKYAGISAKIFDKLSQAENPYSFEFLEDITYDCINHKAEVVRADERDTGGIRKSLNMGHTAGHALELYYGGKSHGEYVAIGMYHELQIAVRQGICAAQYAEQLKNLIALVVPQIPYFKSISRAAELSSHDKKNETANLVSIIAPVQKGEYKEIKIPMEEYKKRLTSQNAQNGGKKPIKLAVIGKDVSKSLSPEMHGFLAKRLGYKITYEKISVPEEAFEGEIDKLIAEYDGINVTIPYKLSVIPHLKKIVDDAAAFGSVNTVSCRAGNGYNTDGLGFMLMLKNNGVEVSGKKVLLLGAGGAGRSVAKKLLDAGASVYVYDRCAESVKAVAERYRGITPLSEVAPSDYFAIINATGVGMHKSVGVSPVGEDMIKNCSVAVDLIYEPKKSEFLTIAERLGKQIINGEAMLFYQAYYSDCVYFGLECDAKQAKKLFNLYQKEMAK